MHQNVPVVSIIIPAKNEEKYISYCLAGIANSIYPLGKIETIVVDNGSQDGTIRIAEKFGATVLGHEFGSISALRNLGAQRARGDILGFVDADCIVSPLWIKTGVQHLTQPEVVAVGAPEIPPRGRQATWVEKIWAMLKHGPSPPEGYRLSSWCASGALLIKKESFDNVQGFSSSLETCEDADLSERLTRLGGKIILDYTVPFEHLRGSKTLSELYLREKWRGKSNVKGVLKHQLSIRELPSVVVPLLFVLFFLLAPLLLVFATFFPQLLALESVAIGGIILLPCSMVLKKIGIPRSFTVAVRAYLVCFAYLLGRGIGCIFSGRRSW